MGYKINEIIISQQDLFSILLTFKIALVTLLLHGIIGVSMAYGLSRSKGTIKSIFESIINIPLIFPPIATGLFLLLLLGRHGIIGNMFVKWNINIIFTFPGLVIASFTAGLPLIVKPVQTAIESFSINIVHASYSLGKSSFTTFITIILPCIQKTVISGLILSFGRSLGEVGITMMIGGNIRGKTNTLSLTIYNAVMDGDYKKAITLSCLLCFISIIILIILNQKKNRFIE